MTSRPARGTSSATLICPPSLYPSYCYCRRRRARLPYPSQMTNPYRRKFRRQVVGYSVFRRRRWRKRPWTVLHWTLKNWKAVVGRSFDTTQSVAEDYRTTDVIWILDSVTSVSVSNFDFFVMQTVTYRGIGRF